VVDVDREAERSGWFIAVLLIVLDKRPNEHGFVAALRKLALVVIARDGCDAGEIRFVWVRVDDRFDEMPRITQRFGFAADDEFLKWRLERFAVEPCRRRC